MSMMPRIILIEAKIGSACLTCDEYIMPGTSIAYCPGVGAWHSGCAKPKNLQVYWDEAQKRQKLGL